MNKTLLVELLQVGDPLADALILELEALGPLAQRLLQRALRQGLNSIEAPPPALYAFLQECERPLEWVEPQRLQRGSEASLAIGQVWTMLSLGPGSLTHTYSAASIARVLMQTGNLTKMTARRLNETGIWKIYATLPGGLERGAEGYIHTVQVRILHARVRRGLLKRGWDTAQLGLPINQVEMLRTWLDFTYVPFDALQHMGITFTAAEMEDLYHLWQAIAHLLGIDARLYRPLTDQARAREMLAQIDSLLEPANEESRALTEAMITTLAGFLQPMLKLSAGVSFDFVSALTRRFHGDVLSDQLGIKRTWVTGILPLIVLLNRVQRWREQRTPALRQRAIAATMADLKAYLAQVEEPTEYQRDGEGVKAETVMHS